MYIENFSLWCDFIERDFLKSGLKELISKNIVNGATSNPAIFKSAFLNSPAYKEDIQALKTEDPKHIYESLAIKDIQICADLLYDLYKDGDDGFISIEVDPTLCDDIDATVYEAKRLYSAIARENVMIKIPATDAGYEAMRELISEGININATLIFSPLQAERCLDAFENGLEKIKSRGLTTLPRAVISIFVSRFDRKMDQVFCDNGIKQGVLGIYNASLIYNKIKSRAVPNVRALFASTGVKSSEYVKDYYISNLLFENSINTAPVETIEYFVKSGSKEIIDPIPTKKIEEFFNLIEQKGIDLELLYEELMSEGLVAFKDAFSDILQTLK